MGRVNLEDARIVRADMRGYRQPPIFIPDAAAYSVLAKHSGMVHIFPNLTADITVTLPTVALGLYYRFIYGGIAADAQDWLISTGFDVNYFMGGVIHVDTDAGAGADEIVLVAPDGNSNSKFDFDVPQPGTTIEMFCDGLLWYINGFAVGTTAPTFADQ